MRNLRPLLTSLMPVALLAAPGCSAIDEEARVPPMHGAKSDEVPASFAAGSLSSDSTAEAQESFDTGAYRFHEWTVEPKPALRVVVDTAGTFEPILYVEYQSENLPAGAWLDGSSGLERVDGSRYRATMVLSAKQFSEAQIEDPDSRRDAIPLRIWVTSAAAAASPDGRVEPGARYSIRVEEVSGQPVPGSMVAHDWGGSMALPFGPVAFEFDVWGYLVLEADEPHLATNLEVDVTEPTGSSELLHDDWDILPLPPKVGTESAATRSWWVQRVVSGERRQRLDVRFWSDREVDIVDGNDAVVSDVRLLGVPVADLVDEGALDLRSLPQETDLGPVPYLFP